MANKIIYIEEVNAPISGWMNPDFKTDLVSVIIPTFQREKYIIETLKSVINQTYRPIEIIIVDDGSTDNTINVLKDFQNKDSEVEIRIIKQKNNGAPEARNTGLINSNGEFILLLDSDDLIDPIMLESHVSLLKLNQECCTSHCNRISFEETINIFDLAQDLEQVIKSSSVEYFPQNIFALQYLPTVVHKRSVFYSTGRWESSLKRWQDLEYQTRMAFNISKYVKINQPMYFFRQHHEERINSLYRTQTGIKAGFDSLKLIEETFEKNKYVNKAASLEISKFYISLTLQSARFNEKEYLINSISEALKFRRNLFFRIRMNLFLITSLIIGPINAIKFVEFYLNLRRILNRKYLKLTQNL